MLSFFISQRFAAGLYLYFGMGQLHCDLKEVILRYTRDGEWKFALQLHLYGHYSRHLSQHLTSVEAALDRQVHG